METVFQKNVTQRNKIIFETTRYKKNWKIWFCDVNELNFVTKLHKICQQSNLCLHSSFYFFWVFFGEDQSCSITILCVCNSLFAWWRHFTTTTRILRVYAFLRKLAPLLFKPCWDYQISRMTLSCKWPIQPSGHAILILYVVIDIS